MSPSITTRIKHNITLTKKTKNELKKKYNNLSSNKKKKKNIDDKPILKEN